MPVVLFRVHFQLRSKSTSDIIMMYKCTHFEKKNPKFSKCVAIPPPPQMYIIRILWATSLIRGLWATSLTWETVQINKIYLRRAIIVITLRKLSVSPFWELNGQLSIKTWVPFTQWCIAPSLFEIDQVVLENKIFLVMIFRYFVVALHLNKLESVSLKSAFAKFA